MNQGNPNDKSHYNPYVNYSAYLSSLTQQTQKGSNNLNTMNNMNKPYSMSNNISTNSHFPLMNTNYTSNTNHTSNINTSSNQPLMNAQYKINNQPNLPTQNIQSAQPNPYSNYYNPLIIQNYYAMINTANANRNAPYQMNHNQQQVPQTNNFYSSPYTMNTNTATYTSNQYQNYKYNNPQMNRQNQPYQNYNKNNFRNQQDNDFSTQQEYTPKKNTKPVSKEEADDIEKWIAARRRNFPSNNKTQEKQQESKMREDSGMISELERKLRQKIKVMKCLDKGGYKMRDRNNNRSGNSQGNNQGQRSFNSFNNHNRDRRNSRRNRRNKKFKKQDDQPEEGEIVEEGQVIETGENLNQEEKKESHIRDNNRHHNQPKKEKVKFRLGFRYRKSQIYENLIKQDKIKEMNIVLQAFRYFVNENLV
jgi:hypothetical protein